MDSSNSLELKLSIYDSIFCFSSKLIAESIKTMNRAKLNSICSSQLRTRLIATPTMMQNKPIAIKQITVSFVSKG